MYFNASAPKAAWARFHELVGEERQVTRALEAIDQIGTSIPRLYSYRENFILNPSNVGTAVLARMLQSDDACSSAFQLKNLMVLSKIGEYKHKNTEISDFVCRFLKRLKAPTWEASMESQLSATAFGFSCTEVQSGLDAKMRRYPVRLSTYNPNTLAFEVDEFGEITPAGVLQFTYQTSYWRNPNQFWPRVTYGWKAENPFETPTDRLFPWRMPFFAQFGLVRIPREKVIHHVNGPMTSFGNPYGATALRTAHLAWQLKLFVMKQLGIAVKRSATPTLWGTAPGGVQNVEYMNEETGAVELVSPREAVKRMLSDRLSDDAVVTGSEKDGYGLEAISSAANLEQIGGVVNLCDVRIFRCFLLPSLVMTDGSAGNRSLGDRHFKLVEYIAGEDAKKFATQIINDLIMPVIVDNFGAQEDEDYGAFGERPMDLDQRKLFMDIYAQAQQANFASPAIKEDFEKIRTGLSLDPKASNDFLIPEKEPEGGDPANPNGADPDPDAGNLGDAINEGGGAPAKK